MSDGRGEMRRQVNCWLTSEWSRRARRPRAILSPRRAAHLKRLDREREAFVFSSFSDQCLKHAVVKSEP